MSVPTRPKRRSVRPTALIVNPQSSERQALERYFAQADYRVLLTSSSDEALELCRKHAGAIHVLVTDPDSGDWSLAESAASIRPGLVVLFLSPARLRDSGSGLMGQEALSSAGRSAVTASTLLQVTQALTHKAQLQNRSN